MNTLHSSRLSSSSAPSAHAIGTTGRPAATGMGLASADPPAAARFLRRVLAADALVSGITGVLQCALAAQLATWLALPDGLLLATGAVLVAYALGLALLAARAPTHRRAVGVVAVLNLLWALDCGLLLASGWVAPNAWGVAWVLAQAGFVLVVGGLQWRGLRRLAAAG